MSSAAEIITVCAFNFRLGIAKSTDHHCDSNADAVAPTDADT